MGRAIGCKRLCVGFGGLWALSGCPSGDSGVGGGATASAGPTGGSTGVAESSTGFDTLADGTGGGTTAAPTVEITCDDMPAAALDAEYDYAFGLDPQDASGTWSVQGLPAGMTVSPLTGELSGAPGEEGSFELLVAFDGFAGVGEATCVLQVGPMLSADLSALSRPCLGPDDALSDVLVGGDGSVVTCSTPGGNGVGARPEAVSVGADTCAIEGAPTPEEWGTWVWITAVEQAGARIYVPYCVTQDTAPADTFDVVVSREDMTNVVLEPLVGSFVVGEPPAFGGEGDPRFEVTGGCGGGACYYGFSFSVGASPFGGECGQDPCIGLAPSAIVNDDAGAPIGFSHELFAFGPEVSEDFAGRPFVLPWELTYCIADNNAQCDGNDAILANAGAHVHVSLLMLPE